MTPSIEEALRSGAVRLVPVEATPDMIDVACAECHRMQGVIDPVVHVWDAMLSAAPDHTAALVALIEERHRLKVETAQKERDAVEAHADFRRLNLLAEDWKARALAAEAKCDALREALAPFGSGAVVFYENEPDDCVLSLGRWKYQEDGRARFYADVRFTVADIRRARALTQEQPNVGE